jgi:hypothetical protein
MEEEENTTANVESDDCPDKRLAHSHIPALFTLIKAMFYTAVVPLTLVVHNEFTLFVISSFLFLLFIDHIYFVLPNRSTQRFVDSTAVSWDIMASHLFVFSGARITTYTNLLLFCWGCGGALYNAVVRVHAHLDVQKTRMYLHMATFFFFSLVVLSCHSGSGRSSFNGANSTAGTRILWKVENHNSAATVESCASFLRCILYTGLALVDSYSFRHALHQERERLSFCTYGALLFSQDAIFTLSLFGTLLCGLLIANMQTEFKCNEPYHNDKGSLKMNGFNRDSSTDLQEKMGALFYNAGMEQKKPISCNAEAHIGIPTFHAEAGISIADPVDSEVMEAFRMAKQQYSAYHGGKNN